MMIIIRSIMMMISIMVMMLRNPLPSIPLEPTHHLFNLTAKLHEQQLSFCIDRLHTHTDTITPSASLWDSCAELPQGRYLSYCYSSVSEEWVCFVPRHGALLPQTSGGTGGARRGVAEGERG
jgi:hypothetical protein